MAFLSTAYILMALCSYGPIPVRPSRNGLYNMFYIATAYRKDAIFTAFMVTAYLGTADTEMAYAVAAYMGIAYVVTADIGMVHTVTDYLDTVYIVTALHGYGPI